MLFIFYFMLVKERDFIVKCYQKSCDDIYMYHPSPL